MSVRDLICGLSRRGSVASSRLVTHSILAKIDTDVQVEWKGVTTARASIMGFWVPSNLIILNLVNIFEFQSEKTFYFFS